MFWKYLRKRNETEEEPLEPPPLSKSSKFNILLMKRTNRLAIFMFVAGILFKIIQKLLKG
jgi:hypothetical protein